MAPWASANPASISSERRGWHTVCDRGAASVVARRSGVQRRPDRVCWRGPRAVVKAHLRLGGQLRTNRSPGVHCWDWVALGGRQVVAGQAGLTRLRRFLGTPSVVAEPTQKTVDPDPVCGIPHNQSRSRTRATLSGSSTTVAGSGKVSPRKWMVPRGGASRSAAAGRGRRKASAAA